MIDKISYGWRLFLVCVVSIITTHIIHAWYYDVSFQDYIDAFRGWENELSAWLERNDLLLDLITVWAIVVGFIIAGTVKLTLWDVMRRQKNRTRLGAALRLQWGAIGVVLLAMAALFGVTLYIYYTHENPLDTWTYLALRVVIAGSVIVAAIGGVQTWVQLRNQRRDNERSSP